ncbi:MAG TPA: bifunctional diguanylate cyclase/phosphodiesterase [Solirubrobacteraceae bacterium]
MPDTPDAAPEPAAGGNPAGHRQPIHIHALAAADGNGVAPAAAQESGALPEETEGQASRWSLSNISWPRLAIALLVLAAGAVASVLGARAVARSNAESARTAFNHASAGTSGAVKLALAHQDGVLTASGTYLSKNPQGSAAEFKNWSGWARLMHNHPELEALSLIALVRAPELAAFHAHVAGVPYKPPAATSTTSATGTKASTAPAPPKLTPNGRSFECLPIGTVGRTAASQPAGSFDVCASNHALLATRDTGQSLYNGVAAAGGGQALEILTPIYRSNVLPRSDIGRRAAFAGWVREVLAPTVLLSQSMSGLPEGAARLRHHAGGQNDVYTYGTPPAEPIVTTTSFHGGWSLKTFAPTPSEAVGDHGDAIALLITGLLASVLAGALVLGLRRPGKQEAPVVVPEAAPPAPREDLYDALTGLPNRGLTMDRAERMLARAGRNSSIMVGALFVDIDWFKDVNEKLGQEAGDQLLKIVAERLGTTVRTHDTVGRYGGDEFVIIVESPVRGMRLDGLARRIIEALHKPVEIDGFGPSFFLTASIGVAFGRYATPDDLLRDAHMALFAAKAAGKDRYTLFNANMRSIIEGRGVLEVELNTALQDGQFSLLYQPVYELSSRRVVALEALLRWDHPTKGEVSPAEFIPLAEESGLIVPIGRWALEQACVQAAAWNVAGHRVAVAVKVSAKQLNREGFATDVLRALQQSGLEPSLLALEIAESTVMEDKEAAAGRLDALKALGVRIAIDDFGSGYAYRADLQKMPIDFLKVDRGSLDAGEDEDYRSWLLEAILVFGRDLSLTVIAKGVESQDQVDALQSMGCTMAQGFFLGEPVAAEGVGGLFAVPAAAAPAAITAIGDPSVADSQ